jgi:hypothetical protein
MGLHILITMFLDYLTALSVDHYKLEHKRNNWATLVPGLTLNNVKY